MGKTVFLGTILLLCSASLRGTQGSVAKEDMFPFGTENNDSKVLRQLDGVTPVSLLQPFQFFNETYSSAYISTNGLVSFQKGVSTFTPVCGALPVSFKGAMVAAYWADSDIRRDGAGDVFYRETTDLNLRTKAVEDIKAAFPKTQSPDSSSLFIVTWTEVPYFLSDVQGCANFTGATNTFQLILSTGKSGSYAILYYNDLQWTASQGLSGSNGNCSGLDGNAAKAGFDVGDGETFYEIPGTCTEDVIRLTDSSNLGQPGKWIFGVSEQFEEPEPVTTPPPEPTTEIPASPTPTTEAPAPTTSPSTTEAPIQEFSCKGRKNGLYPNILDCRTFWKCSNGYRYPYDCPANLLYDYNIQICNWPNVAVCATELD